MQKDILKVVFLLFFIAKIFNLPAFAENIPLNNIKTEQIATSEEINLIPVMDLKGGVHTHEFKTESPLKLWIHGDNATGNWNGLRSKLEENGITPAFSYNNDSLFKATGGFQNKSRLKSVSLINMETTFDTKKMHLWPGGKFYVLGQNVHGKSLSETTIGDIQNVSNIATRNTTQLSEYWYEQSVFDDKLRIKIGKQDASKDFGALSSCADLLNASFTLLPNMPIPAYPNQGLGAAVFVEPVKIVSIQTGVYDGEARGGTSGFDTAFGKDRNIVSVTELSIKPVIKNHEGKYIAGYWNHSRDNDEITDNDTPKSYTGNYGLYASFEQSIYKKPDEINEDNGLNLFGQFSWAPSNRNELSKYYGFGLTYKGLIKKRCNDTTCIACNIAQLSKRLKTIDGRTRESDIELYHKFQINNWLALQPDIQLIINPDGQYKNAFVFGVRSVINF